ncbi:zinc-dependent alcohol dehydrogenase [Sodalis sp. RH22]|uniref:zinc-dependent alcohol dehydrogenase n=1 Tax=unclassified Sodalis (in: enterobacteria) TaxID=2636512 RepID=UPI0039B6C247
MKQAVMTAPGEIVFSADVPIPVIKDNEVLLKVNYIGVCGSDIHVWHGKHPFTSYPVIQGHEFSGTIIKCGKDIPTHIKIGMKATALPQITCGKCAPCLRGEFNICDQLRVRGFQAPGCAQDYFTVPVDRLILLPDDIDMKIAAFVEPVAVAVHAVSHVKKLLAGAKVLVTGAGTIGNLVAQVATAYGAEVMITDINDFRLEKAKACGVAHVVNTAKENLPECIEVLLGPNRFSVGFEVSGVEKALDQVVNTIAKGGIIVAVAVYEGKPRVDMSILGDREISLLGTLMYKHQDFFDAINLLSSGKVKVKELISREFEFDDYLTSYQYHDSHGMETMKLIVKVNSDGTL